MNERLLREWIRQSLLLEAGVEHQEHALVELINNVVAQNNNVPIIISAGGLEISNVTGAAKVTGNATYGGEPYTDVIFWQGSDTSTTPSAGSMNISCKIEGGAPSVINLSKSGLQQCYPGWYEAINQVALEKYASLGAPAGHWSVGASKIFGRGSNLYVCLQLINPGADGKVSIHTLDGNEHKLDAGKAPPIAAGFGPDPTTTDPDGRVHYHNQNETVVPDLFGAIPAETIRVMFVGNEAMGGPVKYIYEGPADPAAGHTFESGKLAISGRFKVAEDLIQTQSDDGTVAGAKTVVLRIRKRRFDAMVGTSGAALEKGPITLAAGIEDGGIRFVSTMKASGSSGVHITIPDYLTDVGAPSGWNPSAPCSSPAPPPEPSETDEALVRSWIRSSLLTEELTKTDKKEIDKLVRKGIERDRAEQKRIIRKEIETELKTSLGKSFFGNPGKVRKAIEEIARAELSKEMKAGSRMEQSVVEITKKVLGAWHEMLYKQQNIINRIKIR